MCKKFLYILINLSLILSQNNFISIKQYSIKEGLSATKINDIIQDGYGFLWVATSNGLNRFNGYNFEIFNQERTALRSSEIMAIEIGKSGKMWIGAQEGLNIYDFNSDKIIDAPELFNDITNIIDLEIRADELVILCKNEAYIYNFELNEIKKIDFNINTKLQFKEVYLDSEDKLWFSSDRGIFKLDVKHMLTHYRAKENSLSSDDIMSLTEDITGDIWVKSAAGLDIYDRSSNIFLNRKNKPKLFASFPKDIAGKLFTDKNKGLWLASANDGLYKYDYSKNHFKKYQISNSKEIALETNHIYEDRNGIIWFSVDGDGLYKLSTYSSSHFSFKEFKQDFPKLKNIVNYKTGFLAIDKENKFLRLDNKLKIQAKFKFPFEVVYDAKLYISGSEIYLLNKNLLYEINLITGALKANIVHKFSVNESVQAIYRLGDNILILAYLGLYRNSDLILSNDDLSARGFKSLIELEKKSFLVLKNNELIFFDEQFSILNKVTVKNETKDKYNSLFRSSDGQIWLSGKSGLFKLNNIEYPFNNIEIEKKTSKNILSIESDYNNNLWISSGNSILQFDSRYDELREFNYSDGIGNDRFLTGASVKSKRGLVYYIGFHGITYFNPDHIYFNLNKSRTVLSKIEVNYKDYGQRKFADKIHEIELTHDENNISLDLSVIEYTNPVKNKLKYILKGFDSNWKETNGHSKIQYTNINPGNYDFYISSSNNDGIWTNEEKKLSIIIHPAIWDRLWFRFVSIAFILSVVALFYYLKMKRVKETQKFLEKEVTERTRELVTRNEEIKSVNKNLESENKYRKIAENGLLRARRETDAILENINEGLFLLNKKFDISDQHSNETEVLLRQEKLPDKNILKILKPYLTEKIYTATVNFLNLLFNDEYDESLILELNPLDRVEMHFESEDDVYDKRILSFLFKRIRHDEHIDSLLVILRDITQTVELEEELQEREEKSKEEIRHLLGILKVDSRLITNYIQKVEMSIQYLSLKFKEEQKSYSDFLNEIFRTFHNLKANASLLDLDFFVERFHRMENVIEEVKGRDKRLSGDDFLPILFEINETSKMIENLKSLIEKIATISKKMDGFENIAQNLNLLFSNINGKVEKLCEQLGKRARFVVNNPDQIKIPPELLDPFKDILVQLVRNSMVHGIENERVRRENNKSPEAELKLSITKTNDTLNFVYRDDGEGLNIEKIKDVAINNGKYNKEQLDRMERSKLVRLIFTDGLSTENSVTELAGRGEGMSLVKSIVLENSGKMKVSFSKGRYFQIYINMPLKQEKEILSEAVNS